MPINQYRQPKVNSSVSMVFFVQQSRDGATHELQFDIVGLDSDCDAIVVANAHHRPHQSARGDHSIAILQTRQHRFGLLLPPAHGQKQHQVEDDHHQDDGHQRVLQRTGRLQPQSRQRT
jgi:hypothetical protein